MGATTRAFLPFDAENRPPSLPGHTPTSIRPVPITVPQCADSEQVAMETLAESQAAGKKQKSR